MFGIAKVAVTMYRLARIQMILVNKYNCDISLNYKMQEMTMQMIMVSKLNNDEIAKEIHEIILEKTN